MRSSIHILNSQALSLVDSASRLASGGEGERKMAKMACARIFYIQLSHDYIICSGLHSVASQLSQLKSVISIRTLLPVDIAQCPRHLRSS